MKKHVADHKGVLAGGEHRVDTGLAIFIVTLVEEQRHHPGQGVDDEDAKLEDTPKLIMIEMHHHAYE